MKKMKTLAFIVALGLSVSANAVEYQATSLVQIPIELLPSDTNKAALYLGNQQLIMQSKENVRRAEDITKIKPQDAAKQITSLDISQVQQTSTIEIKCTATDPVLCSDFANALGQAYIDWHKTFYTNLTTHPFVIEKATPAGRPTGTRLKNLIDSLEQKDK